MASPKVDDVKAVSARLLWAFLALIGTLAAIFAILITTHYIATLPVVLIFGALGAFVSLQRRLKHLSDDDLALMRASLTYVWLAPVAGALLAGVLYLLFIGQIVHGPLFPAFNTDTEAIKNAKGFVKLFAIESPTPSDYAKLLFWSFVAGFSEKFVTDVIGRFESQEQTR